MRPAARLDSTIQLVARFADLLNEQRKTPVDAMLAKYFRENRYIGSHDRGEIAALFYYIIRNYQSLIWWAKQKSHHPSARILTLIATIFCQNNNVEKLNDLCTGEKFSPARLTQLELELLEYAAAHMAEFGELAHEKMDNPTKFNTPEWLYKLISRHYNEGAHELLSSLNCEASVDVRINTLKTDCERLQKAFSQQGLRAEKIPYLRSGLRLNRRSGLFAMEAFQQGWFEVQDSGSQLVADLVAAQAGDRVIDFCAGAGGKTLAIAANMGGKGRILAFDVSEARTRDFHKRLKRSGVQNTEIKLIKNERDSLLKRHKNSANWVLVDAPCTGSGTWRRNPDMKWRTTKQDLYELVNLQARIITEAAKLVKNGGKLVYATCSILPEENAQQIEKFLQENIEFSLQPIDFNGEAHQHLQLLPNIHQTDGFFVAILQKS